MVLSDTVATPVTIDKSTSTVRQFPNTRPNAAGSSETCVTHKSVFTDNNYSSFLCSTSANSDNNNKGDGMCTMFKCLLSKSLKMSVSKGMVRSALVLVIIVIFCTGSAMARPNGVDTSNIESVLPTKSSGDVSIYLYENHNDSLLTSRVK